jgi:hypothetical protein
MRTIELCLCDKCEAIIMPSDDGSIPNGFIIEGNIYIAEQKEGGLVVNNFPRGVDEIKRSEIRKMCLCKDCFLEVLHLTFRKEDAWPDPSEYYS